MIMFEFMYAKKIKKDIKIFVLTYCIILFIMKIKKIRFADLSARRGEKEKKIKKTDFYIINNTESGKQPVKVRGYMFEKCDHWFTVRRSLSSEHYKKWIISDFVTGMIMTSTDSRIENVRYALPESSVVRLLGLYDNCNCSIYGHRPVREELQSYAQMIHAAMFKDNPESKMLELHQNQAEKLFN